jgi:hypothetical protein
MPGLFLFFHEKKKSRPREVEQFAESLVEAIVRFEPKNT